MTIEKKGATKQSADEADKAIRKFVLDNPVLTRSQSIIDKIDRLKKKGILPIKKNKGGGADTGKVGEVKSKLMVSGDQYLRNPTFENLSKVRKNIKQYKSKKGRSPQSRNKMQPSRSMSIDTTTGISKMRDGGICRGAGAAVKGTKFQGVF